MHCPSCQIEVSQEDIYCRRCGADLAESSTNIVLASSRLPAVLSHSPLPRRIAAGVGAVALGVGIELLRRNMLPRIFPARSGRRASLPVGPLKDGTFARPGKNVKLPKGYEMYENVVYMTRIIRRES